MCGICGIITDKNVTLKSEKVERMLGALHHRGPDEEGIFTGKRAVIGAKRLKIIDLHKGKQPLSNEDKSLFIAFNGEIYNYKKLRGRLKEKGHRFKTNTDTEVVLHLYEEKSQNCLTDLNGMFAFGIWDKEKKIFFLARDRLGIKPLYYTFYENKFVFASEIKAFCALKWFPKKIDYEALDKFLSFEYVPSPYSIFKDIKKVPAGHYLLFKNNKVKLSKYWDVNFNKKCHVNKEDAIEKFIYLINDSVKKRMQCDVPIGLFLSGGIDSSTIGYFLQKNLKKQLKTFSIEFDKSSFDERNYFRLFSNKFNTFHINQLFSKKQFLNILFNKIKYLDEPFADPSFFPTYFLSNISSKRITVALSGEGGDELFMGYPTYFSHRLANIYEKLPTMLGIKKGLNKLIEKLPVSMKNLSLDYKAKKFFSGLNNPILKRNLIWLGAFSPKEKRKLYKSDFLQSMKDHPAHGILSELGRSCKAKDFLEKVQYMDMKTYLPGGLLTKVDRASMLNSQEVRVPFLDYRLVEFVNTLPLRLKLNLFVTKYVLKKAMKKFLPPEIVLRRKKGFGIPISFWIKSTLRNEFFKLTENSAIGDLGIFNINYIRKLLKQHLENKRDNRKQLWNLYMLEQWCRNWL